MHQGNGVPSSTLQLPPLAAQAHTKEILFRRLMYSIEQQLLAHLSHADSSEAFQPAIAKLQHVRCNLNATGGSTLLC
jgi:hypothetical protein